MGSVRAIRAVVFASACVVGCGHTQRFQNGVYKDDQITLTLPPIPAEWRAISVTEADLAFRDDAREASILFNGRCHKNDSDTPLVALTSHLIIGTTEREIVSQDTIAFDAREALHTVMRAKLDGVQMAYDIYVLKKDGCVFDFVYVAEPSTFDGGAAAFERVALAIHATALGEP
jgi:hypothetical protein